MKIIDITNERKLKSLLYNSFRRFGIIFVTMLTVAVSLFINSNKISKSIAVMSSNKSYVRKVIIDAGHGGFDGGCVGADGTAEKDINLDISLKLESLLKALGYDTVMIRSTDTSVESDSSRSVRERKRSDINNRFSVMKNNPGSVYLCIHQNNYSSPSCHGAQIFYSPNDGGSKALASCIQSSIVNSVQKDNTRQIKQCTDDVYLIYHATTCAVLVECGFLSNPVDLKNLKSCDYQDKISFAIVDGLLNWMSES